MTALRLNVAVLLLLLLVLISEVRPNPLPKIEGAEADRIRLKALDEIAKAKADGKTVVFRGVTGNDLTSLKAGQGLKPTHPDAAGSTPANPVQHVANNHKPSDHISTSTDIEKALEYADPARGVVMVKVSDSGNTALDLSTEHGRQTHLGDLKEADKFNPASPCPSL
ncbi:hypothetical protein BC829DRAFT_168343 [Chytridium lagenaria]|nr:hypothetical protein BC829DRAFT_168343 [Chytridium lagenaria]